MPLKKNRATGSFLKDNWQIILILFIATALRAIHLKENYAIWWDSSIYLAMAKNVYSLGTNGLWEPYRPLIHPILLGFFWKIGANIVWIGKLLDVIFSLTTIILTYLIGKKAYSKTTGYFAALILAIEPLFTMYTGLILSEPLTLTISLIAIYLFTIRNNILKHWKEHNKFLLIGFLFAFAALSKFPMGILFPAALLARQISQKFKDNSKEAKHYIKQYLKESIYFCLGFIITFIPYLTLNFILYKDPLLPFTSGSWIISTFLWRYDTNFWFYFTDFFNVHQIFLLATIGIILFFYHKEFKDETKLTIFLSGVLLFLYFWIQVPRKEVRYLILIYPFLAILVGETFTFLLNFFKEIINKTRLSLNSKNYSKIIFTTLLIGLIFISLGKAQASVELTYKEYQEPLKQLGNYINENEIEGMILISSPFIAEHVDNKLFPTAGIDLAEAVYDHEYGDFAYVFIDDCDYVCQEGDAGLDCQEAKSTFLKRVDQEQLLIYFNNYTNAQDQTCNIFFYQVI